MLIAQTDRNALQSLAFDDNLQVNVEVELFFVLAAIVSSSDTCPKR